MPDGSSQMLVLCELCEGGHLIDMLEKFQGRLSEDQIIFIMKNVAE